MKKIVAAKAKKALERKPEHAGWLTTDEQEIERRRLRASVEPLEIEPLAAQDGYYGDYAVRSNSACYRVQIRALAERDNSCNCVDYRINGLGTCKHIEAVLLHLRRKGGRCYEEALRRGSPFVEIFLSRKGEPRVCLKWPAKPLPSVRKFVNSFFTSAGALLAEPSAAIPAINRALSRAPEKIRTGIRFSQEVEAWAAERAGGRRRELAKTQFMDDVQAGKRSMDVVKARLYPYQQEGMLHLAFGERALLADEMGLGKTVQAIAACELLRQVRRVEKVLVVAPASLKAEWEEQIAKFTGLPSLLIWGPRAERLKRYRTPSFFYLCNYEQVVNDLRDINEVVAPDVIILDEAQRIKNWQTKTARTIKRLSSPCAFVLTGTPLENRIDELYSIVEFLDPSIFGPLFRFNREFYELDENGRPAGFKNLDEMRRRLRPVMLRRRKDEVEEQLPPRTVKNFFVGMEPEQRNRYDEYSDRVARLLAVTKRRPLTKEEFEKLQRWLACMRMICDTPFILDSECRICPKLNELEPILEDALASGENKVIVFSEWERMLTLVRDLAEEMGLGYARHTGSVPQQKRRREINRFKQDPGCRLFLSTDSGATGLNLQAANVVINLDLPWNPARLEQRIARAWRKHQTRSVAVINLVCENSIEHRMLAMLAKKQQLADGVLDGRGDLKSLAMPSGRAAMMERLQALLGEAPVEPAVTAIPPAMEKDGCEIFLQDLLARLDSRLLRFETHRQPGGKTIALAVVDGSLEPLQPVAERLLREAFPVEAGRPELKLLDRNAYETIRHLIDGGVLSLQTSGSQIWHASPAEADPLRQESERRRNAAQTWLAAAERKERMSRVLRDGGFAVEALPALREGVELFLKAALCLAGKDPGVYAAEIPFAAIEEDLVSRKILSPENAAMTARLRSFAGDAAAHSEASVLSILDGGSRLVEQLREGAARFALAGGINHES